MPNWTKQQQEAIMDRGRSLIVCAAAGSGKTAVLVERIVQLVKEGCPVEQMLVVTFTNAAAGEMRMRIGDALSRAAQERPELAAQVMALSRASISTLHRFCGNLLREHFQALGIDPGFRIGDEQECGVLSRQAMEDALYACYDVGSDDFLAADACYEQEDLADLARRIYHFMMTRPDPEAWLERAIALCRADAEALDGGAVVRILLEDAGMQLEQLRADAAATLSICRGDGGPMHCEAACADDVSLIDALLDAQARGYEALRAAMAGVKFVALGRKKKGDIVDEDIAEQVKVRRAAMKKALGSLGESFALPLSDAAADMRMTAAPLAGVAELVRTYEALYTALKRRRGIMDFNDLEHGALAALAHEEVREALAAQYRYVFIDEYQDSSAIQEAIVNSFAARDSLFLVGDVKQSIYRFRQAEPTLFLEKAALFDREDVDYARRIDLQNNFRSRANVLHGVNAVFERIMRRDVTEIEYDERERLIPGLSAREDDPPLEMHIVYRQEAEEQAEEEDAEEAGAVEREAMIAASRIKALVGTPFYDAKAGGERPLCYRDMAVLMRVARDQAPRAAAILQAEGIPVFCDAGEGYFEIPEIRSMLALLRVVASGAQDEALIAALRGPALGLEESELAEIRVCAPDRHVPYHEAVRRYREEKDDALSGKLRAFEEKLAFWRLCARHQGVDRLIERIYRETGVLARAGALPGGASRQANLSLLVSRARAFMASQGGSLTAFLRYTDRLRAGGDTTTASAIGEAEDVVHIMTTHKSKGLEYPVVIVLGMGRKMNARALKGTLLMHSELGIGLPCIDMALHSERDTLLRRAIRLRAANEQLAEEVRILYVAMTRARERLILIGSAGCPEPPQGWLRSGAAALRSMRCGLDMVCPMLMAAGACLTIPEEAVTAGQSRWHVYAHTEGAAMERAARTDETVQRLIAQLESAPLEDETLARLMRFEPKRERKAVRKLSVSSVIRDEKREARTEADEGGPRRETEIMRLPRFMQEKQITGAQIGMAFHRMMCLLDLNALKGSMDIAREIAAQTEEMISCGAITRAEHAAVPARMLTDFFASPLGVRLLAAERVEREWAFTCRMTDHQGQEMLLQGVIDCCFMEKGKWVLVDYKTDSPRDVAAVLDKHRPQLDYYARALGTITKTEVGERVLYLVRAGIGYPV